MEEKYQFTYHTYDGKFKSSLMANMGFQFLKFEEKGKQTVE